MRTPWGNSQSVDAVGCGIVFASTASHGGYFVPAELNARVPLAWRRASFDQRAMSGWYEEDCDWAMVALTFPELFPADAIRAAQRTYDAWLAPKLGQPARDPGRAMRWNG